MNLNNLNKRTFNKRGLRYIPQLPGVYLYFDNKETPIYIGKSNNLRNRVSSYFSADLMAQTAKMISEVKKFSAINVGSELEALLLEARLINKFKPKYNVSLKDDKHPLYIRITKEIYPQVLTARRKEVEKAGMSFFGPFPSAGNVRWVLKFFRRIFPFSQHKLGKKPCLYSQMGLCSPCPNEIVKLQNNKLKQNLTKQYRQNVFFIKAILSGRYFFVERALEKKMKLLSKNKNYEEAAKIRDHLTKIKYITQPITPVSHFLKNPNLLEDIRQNELNELSVFLKNFIDLEPQLTKIEAFDVAHLSGTKPTASMVTFVDGEPEKSLYRHFRITQIKGRSDTDSMAEVAKRRLKHLNDWGKPDLIIVDGGKAQVNIFVKIFKNTSIPIVGLAKSNERLVIPMSKNAVNTNNFVERVLPKGSARNLVQRLRNEAHRFARKYHHNLLQKILLQNF